MTTELTNFSRLLPKQIWLRRNGCLLAVWSFTAALALAAGLGVLFLLFDLLVYQGQFKVSTADLEQLAPFQTMIDRTGLAEDSGIRATLWRHRGCPVVKKLTPRLSRFIPLRTNRGELATLVVVLVTMAVVRAFCLNRMRVQAAGLAQESTGALRSQIHRQILRLGPGDLDHKEIGRASCRERV